MPNIDDTHRQIFIAIPLRRGTSCLIHKTIDKTCVYLFLESAAKLINNYHKLFNVICAKFWNFAL